MHKQSRVHLAGPKVLFRTLIGLLVATIVILPAFFLTKRIVAVQTPSSSLTASFTQQGPKLVGMGVVGSRSQGASVSLAANGNTAIIGDHSGNSDGGNHAAWIWARNGGDWAQQGSHLVGSDAEGTNSMGYSVSISSDGNTAIVGGSSDGPCCYPGAAWIWTRSGGVWTQQGPKLVGSGAVTAAQQGTSVAISGDGNTVLIGGPSDNYNGVGATGAVWVWTRNGGSWTQQGPKLTASGNWPNSGQGRWLSLSADGNTAIINGYWVWTRSEGVWTQEATLLAGGGASSLSADGNTAIVGYNGYNGLNGAARVWTKSGGTWTQQGPELVGLGASGAAQQGYSVSLSADGNKALVGGPYDNGGAGATWVWTRSGGVWTQQGTKLLGTGSVGNSQQGNAVSLSADGGTALVGGLHDSSGVGAAWVFTVSAPTPTPTPTPSCIPVLQQPVDTWEGNSGFATKIAQVFTANTSTRVTTLQIEASGFFNNSLADPPVVARLYQADSPQTANETNLLAVSDTWPWARNCLGYFPPAVTQRCFIPFNFVSQPQLTAGTKYTWIVEVTGANFNAWGDPTGNTVGGIAWAGNQTQWYDHSANSGTLAPTNYYFSLTGCGGPTPTPGVAYSDTSLVPAYDIPLDDDTHSRTPVILVHGIHGNQWPYGELKGFDNVETPYPHYFRGLIENLNTDEYNSEFKTYKFHYESDKYTLQELGEAMRDRIDRIPGLNDRKVIIVAHSMGGLVSRAYMLQRSYAGTLYNDQESGKRVDKLITLATPHRGTYGSNVQLRLGKFSNFTPQAFIVRATASLLFRAGDEIYWRSAGCPLCINNPRKKNRSSLLWDNYDDRYQYPPKSNELAEEMPETSEFNNKIISYWGDIDETEWLGILPQAIVPSSLSASLGDANDNRGQAIAAYLIAASDRGKLVFIAPRAGNDGLVPIESARFDDAPGGIRESIACRGNNHAQMRDGTGRLCGDHKLLLNSIRNKITGKSGPNRASISSVIRTVFGRLPVFSNRPHLNANGGNSSTVSDIELINSGDQPLLIKSLDITGIDASQFAIAQVPALPFTIPPQTSVTIKVNFSPTTAGEKVGVLRATNDSQNSPLLEIQLLGTGFPSECNLSLSPTSAFVFAAGGTSTINLEKIPCSVQVSASESWLHPSVVGDHVEFVTDQNTTAEQRDGVIFISIDGRTLPFGVSQSPASQPCGLNFSAEQALMPTTGGGSGFEVTTPTNCSWTYQSDSAWLTLGASGVLTGPQQVTFNAPAATSSRTANITVTDGTMTGEFTITQPGPANISGRVLNRDGRGVTNATVTAVSSNGSPVTFRTNRYGYYHFDNLPAGVIYTVSVSSRRYSFESRFVQLVDALSDVDFTSNP